MRLSSSAAFTRHNMMTPLLEEVPSFRLNWATCIDGWNGDGEQDTPNYLALSMLADHLIVGQEDGDTSRLMAAFSVVERWFVEGDDYVQNAAAIGLFEELNKADRYLTTSVVDMQAWLCPVSRVWWHSING